MAEKLCNVKMSRGGSEDNWPDMTGATPFVIYNNRITNVTKNGYKTIDGVLYAELEFDFNFSSSGINFDNWKLTTTSLPGITTNSKIEIYMLEGNHTIKDWGYIINADGALGVVIYGAYTMSNLGHQHIRIKIYD